MSVTSSRISGVVEHGDHRGRELGVPTANIRPDPTHDAPAEGVYAAWCQLPDGAIKQAAVSIGQRPTVYDDDEVTIEVHLLEFEGDLYGSTIELRLVRRVRGQIRFAGLPELIEQLQRDIERCRAILADPP